MSEIVKVDGAWNLTPELAQQMGMSMFQLKKYFKENIVLPYINKKIKENNLVGKAVSKARDGFGKILINGDQFYLSGIQNYHRNLENNRIELPTLVDKGKLKASSERRQDAVEVQTSPEVEQFDWDTKPKEMDAHHKRMLKMYAPFYEGLSKKDAKELTQWFVDEGYALGDAKANLQLMNPKVHKKMHNWMIENRIQVRPGKPGFSNFQFGNLLSIGPNVRGGAGGELYDGPAPKFPNLAHLSLNERFAAASIFLKYVQDPIEEQLSSLINVDSIKQSDFLTKTKDIMTKDDIFQKPDNFFGEESEADKRLDEYSKELIKGKKITDEVIKKDTQLINKTLPAVADFVSANTLEQVPIVKAGLAGKDIGEGNIVSGVSRLAGLRTETIEPYNPRQLSEGSPVIKTRRHEYKAIAADVAGKS